MAIERIETLERRELLTALTPVEMRGAYGVNQISFGSVAGTGAGQTIAIIDAYHDPDIISDTNTFSSTYSLPQFNVSGGPTLQVLNEEGGTTLPTATNANWSIEESLDVEWAHAIAPQANIVVIEASSNALGDFGTSAATAASLSGVSVVSMSFGQDETSLETMFDSDFTTPAGHPGVTFLAASGDSGAPYASYPAFSPNVIAVGGTVLSTDSNGDYLGETGWSSSGGGISYYEAQPTFQQSAASAFSTVARTVPDVAINAGTGAEVLDSFDGGWMGPAGTSLACPMWAGLVAIADQGLALKGLPSLDGPSQTLPMLYNLPTSAFHEITSGNNGYAAGPGYNLVTGLGSPVANSLVPDLVSEYPLFAVPSSGSVNANASLTFSSANSNAISLTDGFAGSSSEQLTLSVSDGSLTLATGSGVTVTNGANGSASMTIEGTLTQLNNALAGLVYAPKSGYSGADTLSLSYVDQVGGGNLTTGGRVAITVSSGSSQAPSITSTNRATFTVGTSGSFTVTATGSPAPTFGESGSLPSGLSFNTSTGVLSGTPAAGTGGTYTLTFTANNGVGTQASQTFTLTVDQAPAITSANNTTFTVGSSGSFTVIATGFPGATLSESGALPSGVSFNTSTGVLSGTPAASTGGTYSLTFTANNGVGTQASQTFTFAVDQSPAIKSSNSATFTVGTAGSFTVTASGFPAVTFGESGSLPSGLSLNTSTGVFSGTPAAGAGGTYTLTITANNGVGTQASQTFTLTVDQAPAITSSNNTAFTVGSAGSFTVIATGFPGATLSESGALPSGVSFAASTGVLSGTPAAGTGGTYSVTFIANNGVGTQASQTFTFTVDQAPAISSSNSATFAVGTAGSFTVTASGFPAVTFGESGSLPSGLSLNTSTGVFSGTPAAGAGGTYTLTFTANNGVGTQASQTFTLTVDQAAAITSSNNTAFTVGSAGSFTVIATGFPAVTFGETGSLPSGLSFNTSTAVLSGTPAAGTGGAYTLTFTANNGVGTQASQTFTLTVDQAPAITSANHTTFTVGSSGSFTVIDTGFPGATLSESGALPSGVSFNTSTGVLSGTPAAGTGGTYSLTFTANNGVGTQASQTLALTVDQAPAISSGNSTTFTVGTEGSFTVAASGFPAAAVSESGALPSGVTFNASMGVLSGTPAAGTGGTYMPTFTANNGVGTQASQTFTLTIDAAPAISSANGATFTVSTAGSFMVTATGFPTATLSESGALPTGVTFNAPTGVLSGTPTTGTDGTYALTFTANNGVGSQAGQTFTLTVDQAPAITSSNSATFTVGTAGSFTVAASGFPAATFGESGSLPLGLSFNASTGVLSGTPAAGTGGTYTPTFTANNGIGTQASQTFTLAIDAAPAISSTNGATFTVGTAGSFTVTATGFPAATLSESAALPTGVTFNTSTGVLSGTPTTGTDGTYTLTFTANNGVGSQASQTFTLTVDQASAITSSNSATFTVGTAGSFTVTATGFPAATLGESGALPSGVTFNASTGVLSGTPAAGTVGQYDVTFTGSNGVGQQASQSFTLEIAAATPQMLVFQQMPTTGAAGDALSPAIIVAVEDQFGDVVTSDASTVVVSVTSGPTGFASGSMTSVTAVNGVATFSDLVFDTPGSYTLDVSDGTLTGATSTTITVGVPVASKVVIAQTPSTGTAGEVLSPSLTVAVEDPFGNIVTSDRSTVTVSVSSGPGVFASGSTTSLAAVNGIATFNNLTFDTAGSYTLAVNDGSLTGATTTSITIGDPPPSQLTITQSPSAGTAGQALGTALAVAVEDPFGNIVTSDTSTVTVSVSAGPGSFATGSTTSAAAANGVAKFGNLIFDTAGTYTLAVSDGALTEATMSVTVSAGAVNQLALIQTPSAATAGQALNPGLAVAVEDAFGNVVTSDASTVTVFVSNGPAGFAAGSTTSLAAVNGMATFSNLVLDTAGSYTLKASDGSLTSVTSPSITTSAASPSQLLITQTPTTGKAGQALGTALKVTVKDAYGNLLTTNAPSVSVTVMSGAGGFASGSTTSVAPASGVATFSNLVLDTAGSYTLCVSDGSVAAATRSITVSTAAASKLGIMQAPTAGTAGQALGTALKVAVEDAFGNIITSNTSTVTASVLSGPGAFATGTTTAAKTAAGVATLSKLIFDKAGTYTLRVSDGTFTSATTSFTVNPAAATKLVLTQKPSAATAGQALSPGVVVAVEDVFGNVVTSNTSTVTMSVLSGPSVFAIGSTTSLAAVNGVAAFNNLMLDTAGSYELKASDGSLTSVTSPSITTAAAPASQLVIIQAPAAGTAGVALATALKVEVKDAYGNLITAKASNVSVTVTSGPGSFAAGSTTSVTTVSGVSTFSKLVLDTAGSYTLSVSDGSLSGPTTGKITVSAGVAAKLAFIQIPSSTVGNPLSPIEVAVEDKFGNIASQANLDVALTVYTGPGPFESGSTTVVVPVQGVASFSNLMLAPGTYTLKATDGSLPAAISTEITIA